MRSNVFKLKGERLKAKGFFAVLLLILVSFGSSAQQWHGVAATPQIDTSGHLRFNMGVNGVYYPVAKKDSGVLFVTPYYFNHNAPAYPAQTGNSGKFLTTNGSAASWGTPPTTSPHNGLQNVSGGLGLGGTLAVPTIIGLGSGTYFNVADVNGNGVIVSVSGTPTTQLYRTDGAGHYSQILQTGSNVSIGSYVASGNKPQTISFDASTGNAIIVTDNVNHKGLQAATDFHAQYTNLSYIDKKYVDSLISVVGVGGTPSWASITGKPTTVAGFGIVDAATLTGTQAITNKDLTSGTNTFPTFNQNTTGSAAKFTTARNINGVAFDGTAPITITANTPNSITPGSGLLGSAFNGGSAFTWKVDSALFATNTALKDSLTAHGASAGAGITYASNVISVDQSSSFTPIWNGAHSFKNGIIVSYNGTSVSPIFAGETGIQMVGANASDVVMGVRTYGGHFLLESWRANGTAASPTALLLNDEISANPAFGGYDGTAWSSEAQAAIQGLVSENWAVGAHGMGMRVNVTTNGSTALTASALFANDLSVQVKGFHMVGQFMNANYAGDPSYDGISGTIGTNNSAARGINWVGADATVVATGTTVGEMRYVSLNNTSQYTIARTYSQLQGATPHHFGGNYVIQTAGDNAGLITAVSIDNAQLVTMPAYGTGLAHYSSGGVISSSLVGIADLSATGTPSSTTWLRGDNQWVSIAGSTFANPSASVGLTAVNGSATTAMRSDAAPALSQAIAPTWTAQHIFALTDASSSGNQFGTKIAHTVTQSSTAGFTDLLINSIRSTGGSGTNRLFDAQVGGTSEFNISTGGATIQAGTATATSYLVSSVGSNYYNGSNGGIANTANAAYQFASSSTDFVRVGVYGSGSSALTTGAVYSAFQIGSSPFTSFSSGSHLWAVQAEINSFGTFTNGGASVTNSAMLRIESSASFAGTNYAIYAAGGNSVLGNSMRTLVVAFASLPSSPVEGMVESVNDSTTATAGATITGGGSNHVFAYYNGTNWIVL